MRSDPFQERARALAIEAGLDPDAKIDRPGQRPMPTWCLFRDAARKEKLARDAEAVAADIAIKPQAAQYQTSPLKVFGQHDEVTIAQMRDLVLDRCFGRGATSATFLLHRVRPPVWPGPQLQAKL